MRLRKGGDVMERFLTVAGAGVDEFTEKRSRFIGAITPVSDEAAAQRFIRERAAQYWDAKHNVYAYVLDGGRLCRFSDDGEPQGTAGMPVLDVLRKAGLSDCAVVVTRYFGGILLGGGGLVRAYSHAAALAVHAAGTVEMRPCRTGSVVCDYAQYGWVPAVILTCGGTVGEAVFTDAVTVPFTLPIERQGEFSAALTERSAGRLTADLTDTVMVPFPVEINAE